MKKELLRKGIALVMSLILAAGCIGTDIYQQAVASKAKKITAERARKGAAVSVNILDYAAHPSETEYSVDSVEGMEKLAELVNSGTESFEGKTVKMMGNIYFDKSKKNNHVPIGNGTYGFAGIFDGGNHAVFGMQITINQSHVSERIRFNTTYQEISVGLFGRTIKNSKIKNICMRNSEIKYETVKNNNNIDAYNIALLIGFADEDGNTEISNCHIDSASSIGLGSIETKGGVGGIVGQGSSTIEYCTNGASIKSNVSRTGGITGWNISTIKRCYNYGNITLIGNGDSDSWVGGISATGEGSLEECVNIGNITDSSKKKGVIGISGISNIYMESIINCYNTGKLTASTQGGVAGINAPYMPKSADIYNVYNIGSVSGGISASVHAFPFGGSGGYTINLNFCYWLSGSNKVGINLGSSHLKLEIENQDIHECTPNQMQTQAFVDQLNANSVSLGYGEVWAADTDGINNGYPILKNVPYTAIAQDPDAIITDDPDQETPDTTEVVHFFTDYTRSNAATKSTVRLYANGGNVAIAGTKSKKNYKTSILYTDILASYKYSVNAKGKLSLATGKVIVGTTTTDQMPVLTKGKIVDKEAAKIATASIKHGQITVTAKSQSGKVYLWAMDTGDAGVTACIPVTVKMAPSAMQLYAVPDTDSALASKAKAYKSAKIKAGSSTKVYLHPSYKDGKTAKKANDATYTIAVDSKALPYFSVSKIPNSPYGFEITAKQLKNGKNVTGKITFTCNQNGKKVVFNATATK